MSGLGTQFIDFAQVIVDSGAAWSLSGTNSIVSGQTLSLSGATLGASSTLFDNGVIQVGTGNLTVGNLLGTGTATIGAAGILLANGTVASGETISFSDTSGVLALGTPSAFAGTIANLVQGDTIELVGISNVTSTNLVNGGTLHISFDTGSPVDLLLSGSFTNEFFHFNTTGGNSFITEDTTPCFLAGTLILTDEGECPVQDLRIGDHVINRFGARRPIKWIGTRSYAGRFVAGNPNVQPIRFAAHAVTDDVPKRDLYVSPQHALYVDGFLIPAHLLVNGTSITRVEAAERVDYFHIELDDHDVIFAEGAPAETFMNCDSRGLFQNLADYRARYPEPETAGTVCALVLEEGDNRLAEIRAQLAERPIACTWTEDPGLHLLADGVRVLNPFEGGEFDRFGTPPWTAPVDHLGLKQAVDCLGERIVVAVSDAANRRFDASLKQTLGVTNREVLARPDRCGESGRPAARGGAHIPPARAHRVRSPLVPNAIPANPRCAAQKHR